MVFCILFSTARVEKRLSKISVATANALAVSINSPGGLPVQSQIICNKIA
jgi:ClpP class serine protease